MPKWEMQLTRQAYADALVELGAEDPLVVVLDADLSQSTLTKFFAEKYPNRFFEMGISEQDMMGTAVGLSHMGFKPFMSSYSIFLSGRAWDQVRNGVAYPAANVKIGAAHGGISVGKDGPTHQSMEDLAVIRPIVNFTLIVPADYHETFKVTKWAAQYVGPVFFRMGREKVPVVTTRETPFVAGKALPMEEGEDGTIIACGLMVAQALEAAEMLRARGIKPRVLNMHTLKPLDHDAILAAARETGAIVTAEEHSRYGGLGSAVAEVLIESDHRVPMKIVAINDRYLESGPPEDLLTLAGLTPQNIADSLEGLLRKNRR
jgi:transketolase